jgi:hypothetical protein
MKATQVGWAAALAAALAILAPAARAQEAATVREIVRVVKARRSGAAALENVRIGTPLAVGDGLRTGGRSAAGMRFADQSRLRIGELSEIVVTSPRRQEARLLRGQVLATYRSPANITGGRAVAAVRGTEVHFLRDDGRAMDFVICHEGRTFVANIANPILAGSASELTGTTLAADALQGSPIDWRGGEVRFVDGPYLGQTRAITGFDAQAGRVTFEPPLPEPPGGQGGVSGFLLVKDPRRRVIELRSTQGTHVREGEDPVDAYLVPHGPFAGLDRHPWFRQMYDGMRLLVYTGTDAHDRVRDQDWALDEAIDRILERWLADCFGMPRTPGRGRLPGGDGMRLAAQQTQPDRPAGARVGEGAAATPEYRYLPPAMTPFGDSRLIGFSIEPYIVGSTEDDAIGGRARVQASDGDVYLEAGYRYGEFRGGLPHTAGGDSDLTEGLIHVRGGLGEVIVGRQHLFLGPTNNSNLGSLMGLNASDGAVYGLPLGRGFTQQVGYIWDSRSVRIGGFEGAFARGTAPLFAGRAGYSLLHTSGHGDNLGWSVDAAQPLLPGRLDVYGEIGSNHRGRMVSTGGLYFPSFYQKWRLDVFAEYANREDIEEQVSLRLRKYLGSGFRAEVFLTHRLDEGDMIGGGGVVYTLKFR